MGVVSIKLNYGSVYSNKTHHLATMGKLNCKTISSISQILPGTTCEVEEVVFVEIK